MSTFYQLTGASKSIFGKVKNQIKINKLSSRIKKIVICENEFRDI